MNEGSLKVQVRRPLQPGASKRHPDLGTREIGHGTPSMGRGSNTTSITKITNPQGMRVSHRENCVMVVDRQAILFVIAQTQRAEAMKKMSPHMLLRPQEVAPNHQGRMVIAVSASLQMTTMK